MLHDVVEVHALANHRIHIKFDDGAAGEVDLAPLLRFDGVFAPLADWDFFASVSVNNDLGTIVWPNGADFCPSVLYSLLTGQPLPAAASHAA